MLWKLKPALTNPCTQTLQFHHSGARGSAPRNRLVPTKPLVISSETACFDQLDEPLSCQHRHLLGCLGAARTPNYLSAELISPLVLQHKVDDKSQKKLSLEFKEDSNCLTPIVPNRAMMPRFWSNCYNKRILTYEVFVFFRPFCPLGDETTRWRIHTKDEKLDEPPGQSICQDCRIVLGPSNSI